MSQCPIIFILLRFNQGEKSDKATAATDCVLCSAGEYQDQIGQGDCKSCQDNWYSAQGTCLAINNQSMCSYAPQAIQIKKYLSPLQGFLISNTFHYMKSMRLLFISKHFSQLDRKSARSVPLNHTLITALKNVNPVRRNPILQLLETI